MKVQEIESILSQISIVTKKNREALNRSEWNFNVFRLCGVDHYETIHSKILAEFLDPRGSHGLGSCFLRAFFELKSIPFVISDATEVITELSTTNGRMDIVIRDQASNWCVVIENKIYASEQESQLPRYWEWATANFPPGKSRILFLTLSGYESSTAGDDVPYETVSYAEEIVAWLDKSVEMAVERPFVRETLRQYRNHIKTLTGKSMEGQNMKEVVSIISDARNFEAAKAIYDHYPDACVEVARGIFADVTERVKDVCRPIPGVAVPTFNSKEEGYKYEVLGRGMVIRIAPDRKQYGAFFVGVTKDDAKQFAQSVFDKMDDTWKKNEWWPSYKYLPDPYYWWSGEMLLKCMNDNGYRRRLIDIIDGYIRELCEAVSA